MIPATPARRRWLRHVLALTIALTAFGAQADPAKELRIGYQKSASLFVLQKAQGTLEKRLAPQGVTVKWVEFPAGPQLLEGLNVGAIDVGFVGEAPPIFAQAAGARFVYVGNDPASPATEAIVVPKDSPLKAVADLKGKRIALNKGSNVHYLLVKLLEKNGLKYSDITPVFLPPADARAAFEKGAVDAWAIWDPFLAAAEAQSNARQLADGTGVVNSYSYYLAQTDYAQANPHVIHELFANTQDAATFVQADVPRAAALIAPLQGLDVGVVTTSLKRYRYGVTPLTPVVAADQQKVADTFFDLKLIPHAVRISDALPANAVGATVAGK
jgi:sulfonate transport system substrate-binding protein